MNDEQDRELAEKIVSGVSLPPEIDHVEIKTGADSTGDPAMWVILWVPKQLPFDAETAAILNKAAEELQTKLLAGALSRFPYVTLDQAA